MMGPAGVMNWDEFNESFPAYLTIAVMPLTYSIANGVVGGLLTYCAIYVCTTPWYVPLLQKVGLRPKEKSAMDEPLTAVDSSADLKNRRLSVAASPHAVQRPALYDELAHAAQAHAVAAEQVGAGSPFGHYRASL